MSAPADARPPFALPPLPRDGHKGTSGRVLTICGSAAMPGAALLVARACQRAGAGLVTAVARTSQLEALLVAHAPECVLLRVGAAASAAARERGDVALDAEEHTALVGDGFHARVLGPGLGASAWTRDLLEQIVSSDLDAPLVVDADGLNVVSSDVGRLGAYRGPVVITPHPGEASRLLGCDIPRDEAGRIRAARELARRADAICCLKGAGTVVTDGERVFVNPTGNAGMATAGSGDVLAGIAGAYLAQTRSLAAPGFGAYEAAVLAVWVHGLCGDLAAAQLGERALVASDLSGALPRAQQIALARPGR